MYWINKFTGIMIGIFLLAFVLPVMLLTDPAGLLRRLAGEIEAGEIRAYVFLYLCAALVYCGVIAIFLSL